MSGPSTSANALPSEPARPRTRRRWLRFSLRGVLVLSVLVSWPFARLADWYRGQQSQHAAQERLLQIGGSVGYHDDPPEQDRGPWLRWLSARLPEGCFKSCTYAWFPPDITDAELSLAKDLPRLEQLDLTHAEQVTLDGLRSLRGLTRLNVLNLKHSHVGDEGLAMLGSNRGLRQVWLQETQVSSQSIPWIASNRELTHVSLEHADLTDESLAPLATLPKLEVLSLAFTSISSRGLTCFSGHPTLKHLYLLETQVDDSCLEWLASCPQLETLDTRATQITDEARERFQLARPRCRLDGR